MSQDILWEVMGGVFLGGIMVRAGKDLKSKELPTRLATGSIIRQTSLVGNRLEYTRVSGLGPAKGWVSVAAKGRSVVSRTLRPTRRMPVCLCFDTFMNRLPGSNQLTPLMNVMKKEGLTDFVIGESDASFKDCKDFDDYTTRIVSRLDENPFNCGRPVVIVAHGGGALPAWGAAKKLGERCLKLYVIGYRSPTEAVLDEVFKVDSAAKFLALSDGAVLERMYEAWPNAMLQDLVDNIPDWERDPRALEVVRLLKEVHGSSVIPHGSKDIGLIPWEDKTVAAPIMALAAEKENPELGETAHKMQKWRSFTQRPTSFRMVSVPGVDHMSIVWPLSPAFSTILADMKSLVYAKVWLKSAKQGLQPSFVRQTSAL